MSPFGRLVLIALLLVPRLAGAWQVHVGTGYGQDFASAVGFDAQRNVIAAGATLYGGDTGSATVVKLSRNGRLLWKTLVAGDGSMSVSVAIDAAGDVVIGGLEGGFDESYRGHFTITKLAGATGAVLWRHAEPNSHDGVVHLDAAGDVVFSTFWDLVVDVRFTCAKLAGGDGAEQWRVPDCGMIRAGNAAGDVVVSGYSTRKLFGATGATAWEQTTLDVSPNFGALDGAGNVLLANATTVLKLDGATGALLWQVVDPTLIRPIARISTLAVDPAGDVVLGGMTAFQFDPYVGNDALLVKRSGADGSEQWRKTFTNGVVGIEFVRAVAVDRRGDVTAAIRLVTENLGNICLVARLAGASGKTRWARRLHDRVWYCGSIALDRIGNFAIGGSGLPPRYDLHGPSASFMVLRGSGWSGQGLRPARVFP